jgi:adenylyltransferase/sulfurtransferase
MKMDKYLSQMAVKEIFPDGQRRIESSSVVVVGMGGTGSSIAEILVRMGLGKIIIVDDDLIETSNLNRQALYRDSDVGLKKVDVAKVVLSQINEEVKVSAIDEKLSFSNAQEILSLGDVIIDGTDNYDARNVINTVSFKLRKPWVFSAVEGTYGYVKTIIPGVTSCLSCFGYPERGGGVACTIQGVIPTAVRAISSIAATLAIKLLIGNNSDGDLIFLDVWKPSLEILPIPRNENCAVCGEGKL